ncbi:hypothetical protein LEMA_P110580.1 [Plenodomus lingam JN3]|uniref:Carbohydrate esterase family 5 protein n=1 Tax=Leptosphaeria maculans (strain JN3 / isolate v23.1.3 / race Av1-4-5-6-7-8) TaxID=985895 RepID=E4ZXP4_LEPMJ|nr:hypothetical protein LEMA_P110580.1 [Plenodomus lingam JN3]CBX96139.1 hypothetical protein LEMA_P110580.1 [Plenodomus lingam JN3]
MVRFALDVGTEKHFGPTRLACPAQSTEAMNQELIASQISIRAVNVAQVSDSDVDNRQKTGYRIAVSSHRSSDHRREINRFGVWDIGRIRSGVHSQEPLLPWPVDEQRELHDAHSQMLRIAPFSMSGPPYESSDCKPFHIFLTRGSDEPYPGRLGNITKEICAGLGGDDCGFENVVYPARSTAWGADAWCKSAGTGAINGQNQMKSYSEKCPDSKLMLLGFSQGAAVAQDMLGGGGGNVFECTQDSNPALDQDIGNKVVAAATFGSVVRNRDTNFTIGDGKPFDGRRARTPEQLSALAKYSDVLLDYCHHGDPICAVGSTPESVEHHLDYFIQHNEEVTKWVVGMAKANQGTTFSAQTNSSTENANTGAAESLTMNGGLAAFWAAIILTLLQ